MEKKQIKISLGTFVLGIIIIILVIAIIIMGMYIANKNKVLEESQIAMENKEKELSINSEIVKQLYSYTVGQEPNKRLSCYRNQLIANTTLEDDVKLDTIINILSENNQYTIIKNQDLEAGKYGGKSINIGETYFYDYDTKQYEKMEASAYEVLDSEYNDIKVFSIQDIQEMAERIYDTTLKIEKHSFIEGAGYCLVYDNDTYKLFILGGIDGAGDGFVDEKHIVNAKQKENEIYIYVNYVRIVPRSDIEWGYTEGYDVYATSDEIIKLKEVDDNVDYDTFEKQISELKITLPIYKHTFRQKDNGEYYWVSTELTNKNELKTVS